MRKTIIVLVLVVTCSAKTEVTLVPGHCIVVDKFLDYCKPAKYGGYNCPVHFNIRVASECAQYDKQRILQVDPNASTR